MTEQIPGRVRAVLDLGYTCPPLTHWLAKAAKLPKGLAHVELTLHFTPPDRRVRDDDNLADTLKSVCDALKAGTRRHPGYGMVPDDSPKFMRKHMPVIDDPDPSAKTGRVWVELAWEQQP